MKALLVGAGGMGKTWARNLASCPRCSIAGWVDARPGIASSAASELELENPVCGVDLDQVAEQSGPDFVVDVTSPEAHRDVTLWALGRGLPVIGEKPMAVSLAQAREMVAASERAGKLYMVSQSRRYNAGLAAFRKAITERLGRLGMLDVDFYIGAHFGGFRDEMASPLVLDMAIHTFDEARFLSHADPVSVLAEEFNPVWSWYAGSASASAIFEMGRGVRFNYRGSWCAEGLPTSWDGDWRAVGEYGSAKWADNGEVILDVVQGGEGFIRPTTREVTPQNPMKEGIEGSLNEFLDALQTGTCPQGECHDNIKSLAMVFAAIEASRSGKRTPVEW